MRVNVRADVCAHERARWWARKKARVNVRMGVCARERACKGARNGALGGARKSARAPTTQGALEGE
eukprot:6182379-Pleurochrysis_carterae.AAC.1